MFIVAGLAIVPAILMVVGLVSVFRFGVRYGRRKEKKTMRQ